MLKRCNTPSSIADLANIAPITETYRELTFTNIHHVTKWIISRLEDGNFFHDPTPSRKVFNDYLNWATEKGVVGKLSETALMNYIKGSVAVTKKRTNKGFSLFFDIAEVVKTLQTMRLLTEEFRYEPNIDHADNNDDDCDV